jgi:hypothetical protein
LALEVNRVFVLLRLIVWLIAFEVLDSNEASPAYVAVMLWVPEAKVDVVMLAAPPCVLPVPMDVPEL